MREHLNMIEIERKFRLTPNQKIELEAELQSKYRPVKRVHQVDEVFYMV